MTPPPLLLPIALVQVALAGPAVVQDFPSTWRVLDLGGGRLEVQGPGQPVTVTLEEVADARPPGVADVDPERARLRADVAAAGRQARGAEGRIVRTGALEPAIVIEYAWTGPDDAAGRGLRLVRRCGARIAIDAVGDAPRIEDLYAVAARIRYQDEGCVRYNEDVPPAEVIERREAERAVRAPPRLPEPAAAPEAPPEPEGSVLPAVLFGGIGLLLLAGVAFLARRGGPARRRSSRVPPHRSAPNRPGAPVPRAWPSEAAPGGGPVAPPTPPARPAPVPEAEPEEEVGIYGLRGDGLRQRLEPVARQPEPPLAPSPDPEPAPAPSFPGVAPSLAPATDPGPPAASPDPPAASRAPRLPPPRPTVPDTFVDAFDVEDAPDPGALAPLPIRGPACVGPSIDQALDHLGSLVWLDLDAPGTATTPLLPAGVRDLLARVNGARFGWGWLLLLGVGRRGMDLEAWNAEPALRARFGRGVMVGLFAFGDLLWVDEHGTWQVRRAGAEPLDLGESPGAALCRIADDPDLRDAVAPLARVDQLRSVLGELEPGRVYRARALTPEQEAAGEPPVEIVDLLDLLRGSA